MDIGINIVQRDFVLIPGRVKRIPRSPNSQAFNFELLPNMLFNNVIFKRIGVLLQILKCRNRYHSWNVLRFKMENKGVKLGTAPTSSIITIDLPKWYNIVYSEHKLTRFFSIFIGLFHHDKHSVKAFFLTISVPNSLHFMRF